MDKVTITVSEAAVLLGISRNSAYEAVRRGELPSLSLGRRLLVPIARFEAMLGGPIDDRAFAVGLQGADFESENGVPSDSQSDGQVVAR